MVAETAARCTTGLLAAFAGFGAGLPTPPKRRTVGLTTELGGAYRKETYGRTRCGVGRPAHNEWMAERVASERG